MTSCFECNIGKSNRKLDDHSTVIKKRNQLEELQERREQIEMILEWQKDLKDIKNDLQFHLQEYWEELAPGFSINENGLKRIKKLIREFSFDEIRTAMEISAEQYIEFDSNGNATDESWEKAYSKINAIAKVRRDSEDNPDLKELFYIRGILKNRVRYYDSALAMNLLKIGRINGIELEELKNIALTVMYMDDFEEEINERIE